MTEQVTKVSDALIRGENATEAIVEVESYEGKEVAIHIRAEDDESGCPAASIYLSPVDAAVHAERVLAAARKAMPSEDSNE